MATDTHLWSLARLPHEGETRIEGALLYALDERDGCNLWDARVQSARLTPEECAVIARRFAAAPALASIVRDLATWGSAGTVPIDLVIRARQAVAEAETVASAVRLAAVLSPDLTNPTKESDCPGCAACVDPELLTPADEQRDRCSPVQSTEELLAASQRNLRPH